MAQRVEILLVDDLDGSEASETVTFALDGTAYEIDLSKANANALREAVGPFVTKARKVKGARASRASSSASGGTQKEKLEHMRQVREWANANGHQVSSRGRIPAAVTEAYEAAVG